MQKFIARKLEEIEAVKYDGTNGEEIVKWVQENGSYSRNGEEYIFIEFISFETPGRVYPGYWVVKSSEDGFYCYSQNDFEGTYKSA